MPTAAAYSTHPARQQLLTRLQQRGLPLGHVALGSCRCWFVQTKKWRGQATVSQQQRWQRGWTFMRAVAHQCSLRATLRNNRRPPAMRMWYIAQSCCTSPAASQPAGGERGASSTMPRRLSPTCCGKNAARESLQLQLQHLPPHSHFASLLRRVPSANSAATRRPSSGQRAYSTSCSRGPASLWWSGCCYEAPDVACCIQQAQHAAVHSKAQSSSGTPRDVHWRPVHHHTHEPVWPTHKHACRRGPGPAAAGSPPAACG